MTCGTAGTQEGPAIFYSITVSRLLMMHAEEQIRSKQDQQQGQGAVQRGGALTWLLKSGHHCFCKIIELVLHVYCISSSPNRTRQAYLHHCRKSSPWLCYILPLAICNVAYNSCSRCLTVYYTCATLQEEHGLHQFLVWQHTNHNMASSLCSQDLRSTVGLAMLLEESSLAASLSIHKNCHVTVGCAPSQEEQSLAALLSSSGST